MKSLKQVTLALIALSLGASVYANPTTVKGFKIEDCRPLTDKKMMMDFCDAKAVAIYQQQLKKPINFNHNYVLFPIDLPTPLKGWGEITNYVALNPKTKQVVPVKFALNTDEGYARLNFNKNSDKVCTIDHTTNLLGDGVNAGTYTVSSDGDVNYCFNMIDNRFFSTTIDEVP